MKFEFIPHSTLGYRTHQQDAQTPIQAEGAVLFNRLHPAVDNSFVFFAVAFLVQLQLRLHVLRGVGDAYFDAAGYAPLKTTTV